MAKAASKGLQLGLQERFRRPFNGVPSGFVGILMALRGFQRCSNSIKQILGTFQETFGLIQLFNRKRFQSISEAFRGILGTF